MKDKMKSLRERWDKEVKETIKNGKGYTSVKEMLDDILGKQKHQKVFKGRVRSESYEKK